MSAATLTVTALGGMVLGCVVVGALGQLGAVRAGLDSTADLAALGVAGRVVRGEPTTSACAVGGAVARADGARLVSCTVDSQMVDVVVSREVTLLGLPTVLSSAARAGPADS